VNAHDVLKYGNLTLLRTIEGLPEADWMARGVCGWWSVKDIVAHLTSYELVLVEVLTSFLGSGPTPTLDQYNQLERRLVQPGPGEPAQRQDSRRSAGRIS